MAEHHGPFNDKLANGSVIVIMNITATNTRLLDLDDHIARFRRNRRYWPVLKDHILNLLEDKGRILDILLDKYDNHRF